VARVPRLNVNTVIHGESAVEPSVLAGAVVFVVALLIGSRRGDVEVDVALASTATFLFGILMAFTIAHIRERLALIQNLVSKGNASLQSIHFLMAVFPEPQRSTVRALVDHHLTDQIDYRLVDHHLAETSHLALVSAVYALEPGTPQQEVIYKELAEICIGMGEDRALIEAASAQSLTQLEWTGLLLLLGLLLGLLAVLPGGTLWGSLVAGVMAGTLVTLMILLRKLDRLRWHERTSIWDPTSRLFRSMGLDPYVPRDVITSGRYRPAGRVRVAEYPDPYPDRTNKIVTVEVFGPAGTAVDAATAVEPDPTV
jgi:hypothetical protein